MSPPATLEHRGRTGKSRFTEEQIIGVLKAAESGRKVAEVCREHGIAEGTYFRWKARYGGLGGCPPSPRA